MIDEQKIIEILHSDLINTILQYKNDDYRLVQICATKTPNQYEITYSFAKEYQLEAIRITIDENTEIFSISSIFPPAFLYENEMKDLFGVKIKLISVDYNGNFYRIDKKEPFKQ